jgi:Zn-finger nucleic acid-binding protein
MEKVTYEKIEVDRCTQCKGIYFDQFEKNQLLKMKGSEAIDIGDSKVGEKNDDAENVKCPRCSEQMTTMVSSGRRRVSFDCCMNCGGSYFDAGEFRSLWKPVP